MNPPPPSLFLDTTQTEGEIMAIGAEQGPSAGESRLILPIAAASFPGFRFSPTDDELISYYLQKKIQGCEKSVEIIPEIEICSHEPWDLPAKSVIPSESEWFFFSARGRKYPNGSQSRRATDLGYWKATGKERNVKSLSGFIGTKRTLVFHLGRAPKGERTEWIMHEFCINGKSQDAPVICRVRKNTELNLNDGSNRAAPLNQTQLAIRGESNGTVCESGIDNLGVFEGEGAVEALHLRGCSSNNSHSAEQFKANPKLADDGTLADSSNQKKDSDDSNEDDYYADILRDEIIKLDESVTNQSILDMEDSWLNDVERESLQSLHFHPSPVSAPTTLSKRARLKDQQEQKQEHEQEHEQKHSFGDGAIKATLEAMGINPMHYSENKSWLSKTCLVSTSLAGKTIGKRMSARTVVVALFVLLVFLLGGFPKIKKFGQDHPSVLFNWWK